MAAQTDLAMTPAPGSTTQVVAPRFPRESHRVFEVLVNRNADGWLDLSDVAKVSKLFVALSLEDPTEAEKELARDWLGCVCRIHERMECGIEGAAGCAGMEHGKHPGIRSLYEGGHRACTLEPGARVLDKRFFELAEFGGDVRKRNSNVNVRSKFMKGFGTRPEAMGAYYCYTHLFEENVIVRVARILGPRPTKLRVIRYALLVGRRDVPGFVVEELDNGDLHVRTNGRRRSVPLVDALSEVLALGAYDARVGTEPCGKSGGGELGSASSGREDLRVMLERAVEQDKQLQAGVGVRWESWMPLPEIGLLPIEHREAISGARAAKLHEFLEDVGVEVTDRAMVPLFLASMARALLPSYIPGVRERHHMWEQHGDACLKFITTAKVARADEEVAVATRLYKRLENDSLVATAGDSSWNGVLDTRGLSPHSKGRADVVEALVGVIDLYCGRMASQRFVEVKILHDIKLPRRRWPECECSVSSERQLTGAQLQMAMRMAAMGLLGQ